MKRTKLITAFLLLLAPFGISAQDEEKDSADISERIVTVGDWEPRIGQVEKLKVEPRTVDTVPPKPEVSYSSKPVRYGTSYHVDPIEAARLQVRDPLDRLEKGYLRLGIGTFTTPVGDAYFSSDRDKDRQYSAHLFHRSSNGGVKNNDLADWSRNGAELRGKWTERNSSLKAELDYRRDVRHHYGFGDTLMDTLDVLGNKDVRQRFHDIGGRIEWDRYTKDSNETDHEIGLDVNHFRAKGGAMQWSGDLDGQFDRYVEKEHLRLDAGIDHNSYWRPLSDSGEEVQHNAIVHLTPRIVSQGENWQVQVGLKVLSELDERTEFHFYPRAEAHYVLFDGIFVPYAGIRGGMERNDLRSLSRRNPHIIAGQKLRNTNEAYDIHGGIRGSFSKFINFDLRASKKKLEDYPLLVNEPLEGSGLPGNRFRYIYDDGEIIELRGELSYYRGERFKLNLSGSYRDYRLEQPEAWHRPVFESSFHGWYDIQDKFTVDARIRYVAPRKARSSVRMDPDQKRVRDAYINDLPAYVDANLGFEYRYTEDLSAFINFNNLLGSRYQRWYGYPVQGFQVLGGLSYSL